MRFTITSRSYENVCENFRLESTEYIWNKKLKHEEIPTFEFYFLPLVRNEGRESLKSLPKRRRLMQQRVKKKERRKGRSERLWTWSVARLRVGSRVVRSFDLKISEKKILEYLRG